MDTTFTGLLKQPCRFGWLTRVEWSTTPLDVDDVKLKAAVAGNARARAALLRDLQDGWYRYALANLLSVSAARDAVQESGLRVLRRLSSYDGAEPIETWSLGAVIQAVREARQLNGEPPPLLASAREAGLSAAPPAYNRQVADVADGLSAGLTTVPVEQREAIALWAIPKGSLAEAARLLGTSPSAVRQSLRSLPVRRRTTLNSCRDWSGLGRYPGNLRNELFRARKPKWLVPAAVGTLAASAVLVGLASHFKNSATPTTQPIATTRPN